MQKLTAIVSGATDGIGLETAKGLARQGYHVVIHGRSDTRLGTARDAVAAVHPRGKGAVETIRADFSRLSDVRRAVAEARDRFNRIDVLVNNAGIYANDAVLTDDGWESTFAVNHLAPFALTVGLLDSLRAAPAGRVVNVSSVAHQRGRLDFDTLRSLERYNAYRAYAQSKLCNVLFTVELQARAPELAVNSLHPGVVSTKLLVDGFKMEGPDSVEAGAATSIWLASDAAAGALRGSYCARSAPAAMSPLAGDQALRERLWELSAAAV